MKPPVMAHQSGMSGLSIPTGEPVEKVNFSEKISAFLPKLGPQKIGPLRYRNLDKISAPLVVFGKWFALTFD